MMKTYFSVLLLLLLISMVSFFCTHVAQDRSNALSKSQPPNYEKIDSIATDVVKHLVTLIEELDASKTLIQTYGREKQEAMLDNTAITHLEIYNNHNAFIFIGMNPNKGEYDGIAYNPNYIRPVQKRVLEFWNKEFSSDSNRKFDITVNEIAAFEKDGKKYKHALLIVLVPDKDHDGLSIRVQMWYLLPSGFIE